jgi:hypothetical protein
MRNRARITGVALNLPEEFEEFDALVVEHPYPGKVSNWSLTIGGGEAWIRGNRAALVNFVESLAERVATIPEDKETNAER